MRVSGHWKVSVKTNCLLFLPPFLPLSTLLSTQRPRVSFRVRKTKRRRLRRTGRGWAVVTVLYRWVLLRKSPPQYNTKILCFLVKDEGGGVFSRWELLDSVLDNCRDSLLGCFDFRRKNQNYRTVLRRKLSRVCRDNKEDCRDHFSRRYSAP